MMRNNFFLLMFLFFLLVSACQGTKDALQGKTRAERSDEFIIEKKNPLSQPPDYNDLPTPSNTNSNQNLEKDVNLKEKLNISNIKNTEMSNNKKENQSLNNKILEEINN